MDAKRYFGLALVVVTLALVAGLTFLGRDHQTRVFTVDFRQGHTLSDDSDVAIARIATLMSRQPRYQAVVVGHSGTRGDDSANLELSRERAAVVSRQLIDDGIDEDRIDVHGLGGDDPLPRGDDEGERRYQQRLARVEVELNYR
ncbi:OmpA family protein [Aquisalimonas asiatica]|uniref:OmpA family protein n=1 Tax=Aquisalimonas asiatica TaxID=406100 RepID=A0A1H8UMJ2_9GAMM|nr:OmpA family protein [Aquisalimonas asiatica]SEP04429.1 OmpA family protein [Aquisalimonas asiatica]